MYRILIEESIEASAQRESVPYCLETSCQLHPSLSQQTYIWQKIFAGHLIHIATEGDFVRIVQCIQQLVLVYFAGTSLRSGTRPYAVS